MRILVLDDMVERHSWFVKALIGNNYHPVYSSDSAIQELQRFEFDMIFLDHDLAEDHYETWNKSHLTDAQYFDQLEKTGYDVAKWMVESGNNKQAQIIIHSCNEGGSQRMLALLSANGYTAQCVSFPNLQKRLVNHER